MLEAFFFIPGNHPKMQEKIDSLPADHFVLDLEDAISSSDLHASLQSLSRIRNQSNIWVRPRLQFSNEDKDLLLRLNELGFFNFIIPKLENRNQFNYLESVLDHELTNLILLIENARFLNTVSDVLQKSKLRIEGIAFGSQDYCLNSSMKHGLNVLSTPRFMISNLAKAYEIKSIDIASMDLSAGEDFVQELTAAHDYGYDAKVIIHPKQLMALKSFEYFSLSEIQESYEIINQYESLGKPSVFVYKGRAIEPPHIRFAYKVIGGKS